MKFDIIVRLEALRHLVGLDRDKETLAEAIETIKELRDEKDSVWAMLEEMKASDITNYKKQIESAAAEKLLLALAKNRGNFDEPN